MRELLSCTNARRVCCEALISTVWVLTLATRTCMEGRRWRACNLGGKLGRGRILCGGLGREPGIRPVI